MLLGHQWCAGKHGDPAGIPNRTKRTACGREPSVGSFAPCRVVRLGVNNQWYGNQILMKTIVLSWAVLVSTLLPAPSQGLLTAGNNFGIVPFRAPIFGPVTNEPQRSLHGQGSTYNSTGTNFAGFAPTGSVSYAGCKVLSGTNYTLAFFAGPTNLMDEEALVHLASQPFRTGTSSGLCFLTNVMVPGVLETERAKLQVRAWDNLNGTLKTWPEAKAAWQAGIIAAGVSETVITEPLGGNIWVPPPSIGWTAFNIFFLPGNPPPLAPILTGPVTNQANGHWYYLLAPTNWLAAEELAIQLGGHLATINNAMENQWVFDTFSNFGGVERALWLGLNDVAQEQSWTWVNGERVGFLNWSPGQPTGTVTTLPTEDYAMMWPPSSGAPLGSWNDATPDTLNAAVVEVGGLEPAPPFILAGPITNATSGHWYYLLNYLSWPEAEKVAVGLGGHLATIVDAAENQWIFNTFSGYEGGKRAMWIGLNDSANEGTWTWSSGAPVTYLNWSPGEPNSGAGVFPDEDHVLIWNANSSWPPGTWNDAGSNQLHSAVVEVAGPPAILAPVITAQPTNLSVIIGSNATFRVTATGDAPLAYQWRFNGTNLLGRTTSVLAFTSVQFNQAGPYSVVVTNLGGAVTSSPALLTVNPSPTCINLISNLVSWWRAESNSLDSVGGVAAQYSGILTQAFRYTAGEVGAAFRCGVRSYFLTPAAPQLDLGAGDGFAVEAWIKPDALTTSQSLIEWSGTRTIEGVGLMISTNALLGFLTDTNVQPARTVIIRSPAGTLPKGGGWQHVGLTYEKNAGVAKLFHNGQLVAQTNVGAIRPHTAPPLYFGGFHSSATLLRNYYEGGLDEIALYDRAITSNEILSLYNAGAAGRCGATPTIVPPSIVVQPLSQRVTIGSNVTLSVVATGSPVLAYQWLRNSQPLATATNSILSFTATTASLANFTVRITNSAGSILSTNASITLNRVPGANTSSYICYEDTPALLRLNVFDADRDPVTVTLVAPPEHGSLSPQTGGDPSEYLYTPSPNFNGVDRFSFFVSDGLASSAPITNSILVLAVEDPPVVFNQEIALDEDSTAAITLGAADADGDALTFTVNAPAHGTLTGTPPNLVYHPNTNYFGPDSFTFSVNDGQTNSNLATVSLTVRPINDPPVARFRISPLTTFPDFTNQIILAPLTGDADVVLDASASSDVENDPLQFFWWEGTNLFATGMIVTNAFPPATHEVTLVVNDGQAAGTNNSVFEVLTPAQSVGLVMSLLENANPPVKNLRPLLASLSAAERAFARGNATAALNELHAFLNKVEAQIAPTNPELATKLTLAVQSIQAASGPQRFGNGARDTARP